MDTTTETHRLAQRIINAIHDRQPLEEIQAMAGRAPAVQLALLHLEREERRIRTLQAELTTAAARAYRLGRELNQAVLAADAAGLLSAPPTAGHQPAGRGVDPHGDRAPQGRVGPGGEGAA